MEASGNRLLGLLTVVFGIKVTMVWQPLLDRAVNPTGHALITPPTLMTLYFIRLM